MVEKATSIFTRTPKPISGGLIQMFSSVSITFYTTLNSYFRLLYCLYSFEPLTAYHLQVRSFSVLVTDVGITCFNCLSILFKVKVLSQSTQIV